MHTHPQVCLLNPSAGSISRYGITTFASSVYPIHQKSGNGNLTQYSDKFIPATLTVPHSDTIPRQWKRCMSIVIYCSLLGMGNFPSQHSLQTLCLKSQHRASPYDPPSIPNLPPTLSLFRYILKCSKTHSFRTGHLHLEILPSLICHHLSSSLKYVLSPRDVYLQITLPRDKP